MLEGLKPVSAMQRCRVSTVAKEFDAKDEALYWGYINDHSFPPEQLSVQLKQAAGIVIGASSIRKHRRDACWCSKLS